jgi:cytochrome c oxidase cbb3-type subunit 3
MPDTASNGRYRTAAVIILLFTAAAVLPQAVTAADKAAVVSSNPMSGDEAAITAGKELYSQNCTLCHGPRANGKAGRWTAADLRVFNKGYTKFVDIVKHGVKPKKSSAPQMQAWEKFLSDEQITQIGTYLETLAIKGADWEDPK